MSGRLLLKHARLLSRSFHAHHFRLHGGPERCCTLLAKPSRTPALNLPSTFRKFSTTHICNDKANVHAEVAHEENEEVLKLREREERLRKSTFGDEAGEEGAAATNTAAADETEHEDVRDPEKSASGSTARNDDEEDAEESLTVRPSASQNASPEDADAKSEDTQMQTSQGPVNLSKGRENESIVERLRKLSMTDVSEDDVDVDAMKNVSKRFDPRLVRLVNERNRVKTFGGGGGGFGYNNNNYGNYDRPSGPSYNNNRGSRRGIYEDEERDSEEEYSRGPRQPQRYSKGGYGNDRYGNQNQNQRRRKFDYGEDDNDYSDDDEDFDASRKPRRSPAAFSGSSARLAEQAQIRRGEGSTTRRVAEDDEYETIIKNRFANRRQEQEPRTRRGDGDY